MLCAQCTDSINVLVSYGRSELRSTGAVTVGVTVGGVESRWECDERGWRSDGDGNGNGGVGGGGSGDGGGGNWIGGVGGGGTGGGVGAPSGRTANPRETALAC